MQKRQLPVWAGLFTAAIFSLGTAVASAAAHIDGTYAAVTPRAVELLTLRHDKARVSGTYRVLHLNVGRADGLDDQSVALSAVGGRAERAFALDDSRTMLLRFDGGFTHAQSTGAALGAQSFARVTDRQAAMLLEMARYGGLYEVCQAHQGQASSSYSRSFCVQMTAQMADMVPFRPFPQATNRPALAFELRARLDRTVVVNR
ncbi:MAG: hypothetical protein NVS1B14_02340 [Vulcanimicrobiaceae bacterium]